MVEKVSANELLLGKLREKQLEITAFRYNGKIAANRMHLEWDDGVKDFSFGEVKDFADEKAIEDYVKAAIIPWLMDAAFPNVASQIEVKIFISPILIGGLV